MLETIIKLFIMQIAYATEEEIDPGSCFCEERNRMLGVTNQTTRR